MHRKCFNPQQYSMFHYINQQQTAQSASAPWPTRQAAKTLKRPGHVHNLLCMIWYLPLHLKVTPLYHSSQVTPEEIQDCNWTNGPSAGKCIGNGGECGDCYCCFIIYFLPPHGWWCRKRFQPSSRPLFSRRFSRSCLFLWWMSPLASLHTKAAYVRWDRVALPCAALRMTCFWHRRRL